jgi:alcohol dehydrogenase, propanol-preferring
MIAMAVGTRIGQLDRVDRIVPVAGAHEVLVRVCACGVCRTDLHIVDRELPGVQAGLIPGHEVVGTVVTMGAEVVGLRLGQRVGIPWLGSTCGTCPYCRSGAENLCDTPGFTGYTRDGGYAEFAKADSRFCFGLPEGYGDAEAAPLLCAGLIGHRSLKMAGDDGALGIYGFGAAAHIAAQVALAAGQRVYAFTRPGDSKAQAFARRTGAEWASGSDEMPPAVLDAAIIFAPVGALVPAALRAVRKGGTVVCGGIHMSEIPAFPYSLLWNERVVRSVANLTRADAVAFLELASKVKLHTEVTRFPLTRANDALSALRQGSLSGAAVLIP